MLRDAFNAREPSKLFGAWGGTGAEGSAADTDRKMSRGGGQTALEKSRLVRAQPDFDDANADPSECLSTQESWPGAHRQPFPWTLGPGSRGVRG